MTTQIREEMIQRAVNNVMNNPSAYKDVLAQLLKDHLEEMAEVEGFESYNEEFIVETFLTDQDQVEMAIKIFFCQEI